MAYRGASLVGLIAAFLGVVCAPAFVRAQEPSPGHDQHRVQTAVEPAASAAAESQRDMKAMMDRMKANGARLDALVKEIQQARGTAQIDAMAELLTALVADRRDCEPMMAHMASMMKMMGGHEGHDAPAPPTKPKD